MLHQVFDLFFVFFFHNLFLILTIIMKCVKILFVGLNVGPEAFILALLDFLRPVGFFSISPALINVERNNISL